MTLNRNKSRPYNTWLADRFAFRLQGAYPQRFLNLAAQQNIRLARISPNKDGFSAVGRGADRQRLTVLAAQGGWSLSVTKRYGPGAVVEAMLARPGLPVGAVVFFLVMRLLSCFVWSIDFGAADTDVEQRALRLLLTENGIFEGSRLAADTLANAQRQASAQSERYGWISLNFTGGCLSVERTESKFQTVQPAPAPAALYAKAAGEILRVEAVSGFASVQPGQYVAAGQMLVSCERATRTERIVTQGAAGRVTARVIKTYRAAQPFRAVLDCLSGQSVRQTMLCVLGQTRLFPQGEVPLPAYQTTEWIPLRLGRVALPASLCEKTAWETVPLTLRYTPAQAAALAARACRRALQAEFPDAVLEAEQRVDSDDSTAAYCSIRYTFQANIAAPN